MDEELWIEYDNKDSVLTTDSGMDIGWFDSSFWLHISTVVILPEGTVIMALIGLNMTAQQTRLGFISGNSINTSFNAQDLLNSISVYADDTLTNEIYGAISGILNVESKSIELTLDDIYLNLSRLRQSRSLSCLRRCQRGVDE